MNKIKCIIKNTLLSCKLSSLLLILGAGCSVFSTLVIPQILRIIVDNYLISAAQKAIFGIAVLYFVFIVLGSLGDIIKELSLIVLGQTMTENVRIKMMEKLVNLPYLYFSKNDAGKISSLFNNDVDSISRLFTDGIMSMAIDIIKIFGIFASIFFFSKALFVILLCFTPFILAITYIFKNNVLKEQIENRKYIAVVNNFIPETVDTIEMIKSFGAQKYMEEKYLNSLYNSYRVTEKINFYDSVFSPIVLILKTLIICLVAVLSCGELNLVGISVGAVAAAIELITDIFKPIENLSMELQNIEASVAGIKRCEEFLNEKDEQDMEISSLKDSKAYEGGDVIKFDNVCFNYDDGAEVINNLNLTINKNENVTLLGRTGAGKSTCFKLILGLINPSQGSVTVCGTDAKKIPNSEKRHVFGYVEQSFHSIKGSIKDEITLKDANITSEEVEAALELVGLKEYIINMPQGIDTLFDEKSFSFGQRQLLSIARAVVTLPPILLLDEMSANLDVETEKQILKILESISDKHTIISISHRLTTALKNNRTIDITK